MYPPACDYRRPSSVAEAVELLDRPDAVPIAGGHGLVTAMKRGERAPDLLVDIGRLDELGRVDPPRVGALVTHADLATADLPAGARALSDAAARVGDVQVRNWGTIGGNLAEREPGADPPAAALAVDATVEIRDADGRRSVSADALVEGALADGDLLTAVRVPERWDGSGYARKTHPATGYAAVGVAAAIRVRNDRIADARVAATGVADRAIRLRAVEDALAGRETGGADVAAETVRSAVEGTAAEPTGDAQVTAAYRVGLLPRYVERAVTRAAERAGEGVES
jgi:carbon-monoxide dehydrogenase medium subunit